MNRFPEYTYEREKREARKVKIISWFFCGLFTLILAIFTIAAIVVDYQYDKTITSFWDLSVKASTIEQKSAYLDSFVSALETAHLAKNSAVVFQTPNTSTAQNMIALKSLQGRMHAILSMDVQSFAYQQAIQQITAQEQDEAGKMLDVFKNAWYLETHPLLYDWIAYEIWIVLTLLAAVAGFLAWNWEG